MAPQSPPPILSGDQPVRGVGVGNAQQRLGEAHQQHALPARQAIFMHEGIDAASLVPPCPRREHKLFGELRDLALLLLAASRALDEGSDKLVFIRKQRFAETGTAR